MGLGHVYKQQCYVSVGHVGSLFDVRLFLFKGHMNISSLPYKDASLTAETETLFVVVWISHFWNAVKH